jgi:hypothetical protein
MQFATSRREGNNSQGESSFISFQRDQCDRLSLIKHGHSEHEQSVKWNKYLYRIYDPYTRGPRSSRSLGAAKYLWWEINDFIVDVFTLPALNKYQL